MTELEFIYGPESREKPKVWKYGRHWWAIARLDPSDHFSRYQCRFPTWKEAIDWALKPCLPN